MIRIRQVSTSSKAQVRRFVRLPYPIYRQDPVWVPPLDIQVEEQLDRQKFPFYEYSNADFFIAEMDGKDVGRIAVLENCLYNQHQGTRQAHFFHFECIDDQGVANALFERAFDWAHRRGLDTIVGPRGLSPIDGYGLLTDGFYLPQMMSMMNHNPPYYVSLLETLCFEKMVHYLSCYASPRQFTFSEKVHQVAERVQQRGTFHVQGFKNMRELRGWVPRIGRGNPARAG